MNCIESEVDSLYIGQLGSDIEGAEAQTDVNPWYTMASVRGMDIKFKLDTGADANVLPMSIFQTAARSPSAAANKDSVSCFWGSSPAFRRCCVSGMQDSQAYSNSAVPCD